MSRKGYFGKKGKRRKNTREIKPLILIVCEGEKTEKYYFDSFEVSNAYVKVEGEGRGANVLLKAAKKYFKKEKFDQVWLVFDKDEIDDQKFDESIKEIKKKGYNPIYSNPCFELWYLLHFVFYQTSLSKEHCLRKLKEKIPEYEKNIGDMYERLKDKMKLAIKNAENLEKQKKVINSYSKKNPYTNVYKLVEELRKYER
ncbi:RloB-like protein [Marinitoga hydrogenitolerans DSM 16785]|uniref:RloB-like protein n=1 Tax=Marinitoga hydrogenitolerans (strain DSM 16785 / JCM 12826 / AT1271) TaxID=1122195 RepID=A0A1M4TD24_MARH1|nr:RloB family protein [Marinitoga hydrogenitolerans]SHE42449.1 RloB-like protein [Marinitoga hydrogenitolerans DSM 16785]